ncbi:MAG: adenosylcobinamide-GDP ribazoletransferase [Candidatus Omnitrophota bacterium]|nr:adenosylcobinamide-GDP ribazoletransferase [Candidatus Omnitrophota bacterium]
MKRLLIALQFLTVLPFNIHKEITAQDYGRSLVYFPAVGAAMGGVLSFVSLSCGFLPVPVAAAIVLIASAFITGALHLDGFADTCDGFYGSKPKEEILEIMRDPRIGVMGVAGITLLLLLKFSLIISIPKDVLWRSLITMCCLARWTQAIGCLLPYARNEGKAGLFIKYARKKDIIIGGIFTIIVFSALFGLKGIIIFFSSLISALLFIRYVKARIGGMTGDTIGAVSEITEVSALFFILTVGSIWT